MGKFWNAQVEYDRWAEEQAEKRRAKNMDLPARVREALAAPATAVDLQPRGKKAK